MTPLAGLRRPRVSFEDQIVRVMRNEIRIAEDVTLWERLVEATRIAERWECWDSVQGRWRRYWRRDGSLPGWADE